MRASVIRRLTAAASCAVVLSACAYSTAIPVHYSNTTTPGFRVYDLKPILIVNGQQITVDFIPNFNKAYAMQFGAFIAKNDFTVEMSKGYITKLDGKLDSTAIVPLLQELVKTLGPALTGKGMSGGAEGGVQDRFQVYEFVFDDDGNLVGLRPLINPRELLHVRTSRLTGGSNPTVVQQPSTGGGGTPSPGTVQ
jgi:hypothetical protein